LPLPDGASSWTSREKNLWIYSRGAFNPGNYEVASKARKMTPQNRVAYAGGKSIPPPVGSVSMILCTSEEQRANHKHLWTCFEGLDYADKELIIVETYLENTSEFWTSLHENDSRVHYIPFMRKSVRDWSLGLKRGIGVHVATAEFIANFDEGSIYAPDYLATMIRRLREGKAGERPIAVTTSRSCIVNRPTDVGVPGTLDYWDPAVWGPEHQHDVKSEEVRRRLYGGSWSYVYRREIAIEMGFPDTTEGQDYAFYSRIMSMEGSSMVALVEDDDLCLHEATPEEHAKLSCSVRELPVEDIDMAKWRISKCKSANLWMQNRGVKSRGMAALDAIPTAPMMMWGDPLPEKERQGERMGKQAFNALMDSLGLAEAVDASADTEGDDDEEEGERKRRAERVMRPVPEGWGPLEHKSASEGNCDSAQPYHSKDPSLKVGAMLTNGSSPNAGDVEEPEYETWSWFQRQESRKSRRPKYEASSTSQGEEAQARPKTEEEVEAARLAEAEKIAAAERLAETMRADEEAAKKASEAAAKAAEDLAAAQAKVAEAKAELEAAQKAKEEALRAPPQADVEDEMAALKAQLEALRKENAALKQ